MFGPGSSERYEQLLLKNFYDRISPCSRASFPVATCGYSKIGLDWWTVGFVNVNQKSSSSESLLQLGTMRGRISSLRIY